MTILLAYFADANAEYMLASDANGNFKVDFGPDVMKNPPRAGIDSVHKTVYVKNVHHFPMELRPYTLDDDLTITEYPEFLEPGQTGKVTLTFSPSEDRIKPLEGGSWDFTKVVYARTSSTNQVTN
jgi:hypothetical protein